MDPISEYVRHLMAFVRLNNMEYARWAAPKYEKTDPFRLTGLAAALDVEIARYTQKLAASSSPSPAPLSAKDAPASASPSAVGTQGSTRPRRP